MIKLIIRKGTGKLPISIPFCGNEPSLPVLVQSRQKTEDNTKLLSPCKMLSVAIHGDFKRSNCTASKPRIRLTLREGQEENLLCHS